MSKAIKQHLEIVTPENLRLFRDGSETFISFASSICKNGRIEVGVNGKGQYGVKTRNGLEVFMNALQAVKDYSEKVTNEK